ncbi:MAG: hypothetical protein WC254_00050 [Candidatus Woesearchaeota archaeon]|jgi:hypothetical protein
MKPTTITGLTFLVLSTAAFAQKPITTSVSTTTDAPLSIEEQHQIAAQYLKEHGTKVNYNNGLKERKPLWSYSSSSPSFWSVAEELTTYRQVSGQNAEQVPVTSISITYVDMNEQCRGVAIGIGPECFSNGRLDKYDYVEVCLDNPSQTTFRSCIVNFGLNEFGDLVNRGAGYDDRIEQTTVSPNLKWHGGIGNPSTDFTRNFSRGQELERGSLTFTLTKEFYDKSIAGFIDTFYP